MRVTRFDRFLDRNYHAVMCACQVVIALSAVQIALFVIYFAGRAVWG